MLSAPPHPQAMGLPWPYHECQQQHWERWSWNLTGLDPLHSSVGKARAVQVS